MDANLEIKVRYLGAFADAARSKEEICELASSSVGALVERLLERNGEKFQNLLIDPSTGTLRGGTTLLVNGHKREMQHELSDGDEVVLLTPVAGG